MKCAVIIVAAGKSARFKSIIPKPFALLKKIPLIVHSLTVFDRSRMIDSIVIVGSEDYLGRLTMLAKKFKKVRSIVKGGLTRADSVANGLKAINPSCDYVLVHDAARPLINAEIIGRIIVALTKSLAVIVAVPVKPTIKQVDVKSMQVIKTIPRDSLWEVQTPQGFKRSILEKAHANRKKSLATDDAMLVEQLGIKVKVVMGDYRNLKVTTPEDLLIAKALI